MQLTGPFNRDADGCLNCRYVPRFSNISHMRQWLVASSPSAAMMKSQESFRRFSRNFSALPLWLAKSSIGTRTQYQTGKRCAHIHVEGSHQQRSARRQEGGSHSTNTRLWSNPRRNWRSCLRHLARLASTPFLKSAVRILVISSAVASKISGGISDSARLRPYALP